LLFTMLGPVLVLTGSLIFFYILEKVTNISKRTSHTLLLIAGLSNTSFVGFPLITAYFGTKALPIGFVSDQMTFFLLSTVGVVVAMKGSLKKKNNVDIRFILKRVFTFPPLIGALLALTVGRLVDLSSLDDFFKILGSTVSPIALFSIGLQLHFGIVKSEIPNITYALVYKLILAPAIVVLVALMMGLKGEIVQVSIFEMAMPSLVATSIILSQFKLNSKVGNSVIGMSIPLGLLSTYLWYQVLITFLM